MRAIIIVFVYLISPLWLFSQQDCLSKIGEADKLMHKGQFKKVTELLEPCVPHLTKNEKFEACRLLSQAHLALLNNERSEYYLKLMLKLNPDYQKFPELDPIEFTKEMRKYKTLPDFLFGITAGLGVTNSKLNKSYAVYGSPQSYLPTTEYHIGAVAEYFLYERLSLQMNLLFNRQQIHHIVDDAGGWSQDMTETQNYFLLLPTINAYAKLTENLTAYGAVGFGINRMNEASVFMTSENLQGEDIQLASKDATSERIQNQPVISGKIGIQTPVGKGLIAFETQYLYFLRNTVNPDDRMNDINFIFNNQYVHDDVSLRSFLFSLSYRIPLSYKVKSVQ